MLVRGVGVDAARGEGEQRFERIVVQPDARGGAALSMRAVTDYMIGTDQEITRLDVLFGSLVIRPEWMCIVPDKV